MKAAIHERYGSPASVVELRDVELPELPSDGVLVRVCAASVNRIDWYGVTGTPLVSRPLTGLRRPRSHLLGADFAGVVEAVGSDVTEFQPGDGVFGGRSAGSGSFAEYVCARDGIARKPANLSFEQAAAVPLSALTALQGLRDRGRLVPGQHVLVNGASGGVGTFAVQIAKALGAEVTAVCSTRNVEQSGALGADHVVDYTRDDFTRGNARYDLILDVAGSRSWRQCRRVMKDQATLVIVGGASSPLLGPLGHIAKVRLAAMRHSQTAVFFIASWNRPDMDVLRGLLEAGTVMPVVERQYALTEVADALAYMGEGHVRSKLVVSV